MADYERINFKKDWHQEVKDYLKDNPELGFDPDDVKYFIKYCVQKQMNESLTDEEKIDKLLKEIK